MFYSTIIFSLLSVTVASAAAIADVLSFDRRGLGAIQNQLPVIDLGYSQYQATFYNETQDTYTFKNVRYAAPPTGPRRWMKPDAPETNRTVQDGTYGNICLQAVPKWATTVLINNITRQNPKPQSEDCLFLDIVVPRKALSGKQTLPVLFWIPGGGFVSGSKEPYNPTGLMERAEGSYIFVGMNYRLGAFGWLSGPTLTSQGGDANGGFHDQQAALKWVHKYIGQFGGDASELTVIGESAGGSSITHHLTAYVGTSKQLFKRGIVQSPGFLPMADIGKQEQVFRRFATEAGCLNGQSDSYSGKEVLDCLRGAPSEQLDKINKAIVAGSHFSKYEYGPVIDGDFVQDFPQTRFEQGKFDHNVELIIGRNSDEGISFVDPNITTPELFKQLLDETFTTGPKDVVQYLTNELYPESEFDNSYDRAKAFATEYGSFNCANHWLSRAYGNKTYNYIFSFAPGSHGQDLPYTFFKGDVGQQRQGMIMSINVDSRQVAVDFQKYIRNFVVTGDPNSNDLARFPRWGDDGRVIKMDMEGFNEDVFSGAEGGRCEWWQKGLFY